MYVERKIDRVLSEWYRASPRKPLVLRGARQTGKSTSVRKFGRDASLYVELNFERPDDLRLVRSCRSADELLQILAMRHDLAAMPPGTLLFLDEVQAAPEVISWLRFFHEDHPEIAVVAAGSLLEVRMAERGFSFPVGRVTFRTMRPLSFLEFARAVGKDRLVQAVTRATTSASSLTPAIHLQAMAMLRDYLLVGGMPEAVVQWCDAGALAPVRQVHLDLRQAFGEDIQKYGGRTSSVERVFHGLSFAYGQRFKYEHFVAGMPSKVAHAALDKLEGAELVKRVVPTGNVRLPLRDRPRSAAKLLPLDVGLAVSELGVSAEEVYPDRLTDMLDGRIAECFVGQQLLSTADCSAAPLHFWVRESSTAAAETDFLVTTRAGLLPVEVKSGKSGSLKSLHQFLRESGGRFGLRLNTAPPTDEDCTVRMPDAPLHFRLLSLPLYCAELVRDIG